MNAFLKKEIRLLLPSFLIGCALTFSNWLLLWENNNNITGILAMLPSIVCPAVAVMIALNSFGVEISSGTFTNLLAQPISRLKIWETKISLLAMALMVVGVLWFGSVFCVRAFFSNNFPNSSIDLQNLFVFTAMFGLVVFSGGLWTVLLLRQVAAAFWFTLLVPGVLMGIVVGLFADYSGEFVEGMTVMVLGLYSLVGFFLARWLFLRAQDVQWSGGTIVMPKMRGLPAWFSNATSLRLLRPRAALWRKEFQLHQAQFFLTFVLLPLHLGVIALRTFWQFQKNSTTEVILEGFWCLWLVMPVLVGCTAIAEERKLGTLESQLCLPVKRRTQFAIKFFAALFLSVFLGAVMPLLLEGTRILPDVHIELGSFESGWQNHLSVAQIFMVNCLGIFIGLLPLLALAGIAAAFYVISFYVSSLTRNTLQSLAPAMLGILLAFFGVAMIVSLQEFDLDFLWRGSLPFFIGGPIMLLTLVALTFGNFQHVRTGWRMWRQNFFRFALALIFSVAATSAIYHRVWEKFTPFEPPHGAARLSQENHASLTSQSGEISVRLPDGKIWMSYFMADENNYNPISRLLGNVKISIDDGKFIAGTNWLTVQRSYRELVGLKTDGSLWVSEGPQQKGRFQNGKWIINQDKMQHLVPFGNETNWNSFTSVYLSALLVKNDGTLWRWGTNDFDFKHHEWPGLRTFTPYRLGMESNWAKIYESSENSYRMYLHKTDGSLWTWDDNNNWTTNGETRLKLEPDLTLQSVKNPGREQFRSVAQISHGLGYKVGVRDDGTFRIWADERLEFKKHYGNYVWFPTDLQIGSETNWIAVAGEGEKIVVLKNDGSLWLWDFHRAPRAGWGSEIWDRESIERKIQNTRPTRLGTHADWIAISGGWGNVTALAADGSLWWWPLERSDYYFGNDNGNGNGSHLKPLLDISRKPQLLGNVFGKAD